MNTEHTQHPCETVDASADVMKLAEMILSNCGCSTAISDRLQRRVAGRIQLYVDNATQQLQGQVGALLAAMDVIALGELPDGKYANISTMMYAEEACKAAQRAPIKESLTADRQAEPVAWVRFCSDGCYEGPIMNSDSRMDGVRRTCGAWTPLYAAQPPAVADGCPKNYKKLAEWLEHENAVLRHQAVAVPEPDGWRDAATSALRFIEANAGHDPLCNVFDLDDDRRHKGCTCGMEDAVKKLRAMLAAAPQAAVAAPLPPYDTFSNDDGDSWQDCPDDAKFVNGRQLGEEFELLAGWHAERVTFRVTKVPDDESDDYEVEEVTAPAAAQKGGEA